MEKKLERKLLSHIDLLEQTNQEKISHSRDHHSEGTGHNLMSIVKGTPIKS